MKASLLVKRLEAPLKPPKMMVEMEVWDLQLKTHPFPKGKNQNGNLEIEQNRA